VKALLEKPGIAADRVGKEVDMLAQALFGIRVGFSFIAWGLVVRLCIWPVLRNQQRRHALLPILVLHSFRFIGLAFLIPGVVSPQLPMAFARPAAFGDLSASNTMAQPWTRLICRPISLPRPTH
jgi:hypothetical protein